nr:PREDICTED: rRNA methyltransferase 1, mitochondrial [Latimeria chalumnae]|eukprot:XP_014342763.1 PREDICTED: rRNA methyltransferase 1, mitochondrial [Latimeria chalumnae]
MALAAFKLTQTVTRKVCISTRQRLALQNTGSFFGRRNFSRSRGEPTIEATNNVKTSKTEPVNRANEKQNISWHVQPRGNMELNVGDRVPRKSLGNWRRENGLNLEKPSQKREEAFRNKSSIKFFNLKSVPNRDRKTEFCNLRDDDFPKRKQKSKEHPRDIKVHKNTEILFGIAPCHLALSRSRRSFLNLFIKDTRSHKRSEVQDVCRQARDKGVPVQQVTRRTLDALCKGRVHQGVCLEATPLSYISYRPDSETEPNHPGANSQPLWLVLEGIQDPMNMGAILRSAYFLGADQVVISQRNSCSLSPVVSKASAGTMEISDVYGSHNLVDMLKVQVTHCFFPLPSAGNEGCGLSNEVSSTCQMMLTIPPGRELQSGIESLNVSVAAGILLHAISSKRLKS